MVESTVNFTHLDLTALHLLTRVDNEFVQLMMQK